MKYVTHLLAHRYLIHTAYDSSVSTMAFISFIGITIGSAALALTLFVTNGFEEETHQKLQGIHAQASIRAYGATLNVPRIEALIAEKVPSVAHLSPAIFHQGLIHSASSEDISNVVMLKGIDPEREALVSTIERTIHTTVSASKTLAHTVRDNYVLIGKKLAENLEVSPGDPITILFTNDENSMQRKVTFEQTAAIVGGTFSTGIEEIDTNLVYRSMPFMHATFPDDTVTHISVRFHNGVDEKTAINILKQHLPVEVYSWKDLYPAIVAALILEKYVMFMLLALITLVASMNIISLLYMKITQKRSDIAILKAMGLASSSISTIFLMQGILIALVGCALGIAIAVIVGFILDRYHFIELPDAYYVTHLPVHIDAWSCLVVFSVVMLLSILATWLPSRMTRSINISHVLRFEG